MKLSKEVQLFFLGYLLLSITTFTSCKKESIHPDCTIVATHELSTKYCDSTSTNIKHYFFAGHTYERPQTIDSRLACLDYSCYDQIWLGGDLCSETTQDYETLNYLDNLFNLSAPTTHWALGNHDIRNGNISWITEKTKRPTFYTANFDGITLMVLNSNFLHSTVNDSVSVNEQFDMIQAVCDTIQNSSHLIILSHHLIWYQVPGLSQLQNAGNLNYSSFLIRLNPNKNYAQAVYPLLKQVTNRGVKVINIAGNFGQYNANHTTTTTDGIEFIGSGISSEIPWHEQFPTYEEYDEVLVLHHDLATKTITWTFDIL